MESSVEKNALIEAHLPLAVRTARKMAWRARVTSVEEREEMYADALLGLVEAAGRWRRETGVPFGAFARLRIVGAVCDGRVQRRSKVPTVSLDALLSGG